MLPEIVSEGLGYRLKATGYPASYPTAFKRNVYRIQNRSPGVIAGLSTVD
jgi:hypothetical protein